MDDGKLPEAGAVVVELLQEDKTRLNSKTSNAMVHFIYLSLSRITTSYIS
jgi:hypothetical protein